MIWRAKLLSPSSPPPPRGYAQYFQCVKKFGLKKGGARRCQDAGTIFFWLDPHPAKLFGHCPSPRCLATTFRIYLLHSWSWVRHEFEKSTQTGQFFSWSDSAGQDCQRQKPRQVIWGACPRGALEASNGVYQCIKCVGLGPMVDTPTKLSALPMGCSIGTSQRSAFSWKTSENMGKRLLLQCFGHFVRRFSCNPGHTVGR